MTPFHISILKWPLFYKMVIVDEKVVFHFHVLGKQKLFWNMTSLWNPSSGTTSQHPAFWHLYTVWTNIVMELFENMGTVSLVRSLKLFKNKGYI